VFLRPIAHRGLHDTAKGRIENTAPAFLAAIEKGYGIECDLQTAADGTPMVFHDAMLGRLVEASGPVALRSPADLARLRYRGQDTGILTFRQLLDLVHGRVPLLVEVKSNGKVPKRFLEKIARDASAYEGPVALMSFNRKVMAALHGLAPKVPRGLVVGSHQMRARLWTSRARGGKSAAVAALLDRLAGEIDFLALDVKLLAAAAGWILHHRARLPVFTWTVRTLADRPAAARYADAPIFEGYEP
jgi:glycerophosphoryl diester phosphodiesterase